MIRVSVAVDAESVVSAEETFRFMSGEPTRVQGRLSMLLSGSRVALVSQRAIEVVVGRDGNVAAGDLASLGVRHWRSFADRASCSQCS